MRNKKENAEEIVRDKNYSLITTLSREWSLCIPFLGKILLITGPYSSGKTTLVCKIVEKYNLKTINRKKLTFEIVNPEINNTFFSYMLQKAQALVGEKAKDITQLRQINVQSLSVEFQEPIRDLQHQAREIINTGEYQNFVLNKLFCTYYNEMKKYIFSGYNIILDEALIDSEESINIFHHCCGQYPHIRTALLFNSMEETLRKYIIRNDKFFQILAKYEDLSTCMKEQLLIEKESGGSGSTYRIPQFIIEAFKSYYNFTSFLEKGDIVLQEITIKNLEYVIARISGEQLRVLQTLANKGHPKDKFSAVDVQQALQQILPEKSINKVYITIKENKFDYIIKMPDSTSLDVWDNPEFVTYLLGDILPWLT